MAIKKSKKKKKWNEAFDVSTTVPKGAHAPCGPQVLGTSERHIRHLSVTHTNVHSTCTEYMQES